MDSVSKNIAKHITTEFSFYLILLLLTAGLGLWRWRKLGKADRWLSLLMVVSLVQEIIAKVIIIFGDKKDNLYTYNIYTPVEFFLVCMYFNHSLAYFRKRSLGLKIGLAGVVLCILYIKYIQPLQVFGNYMLFFESLIITVFCFVAFYQLLMEEDLRLLTAAGFWLTVCLMLYWSTTFAGWGLWNIMKKQQYQTLIRIITNTLKGANYVFYSGVALVFLNYPKLKPSGE